MAKVPWVIPGAFSHRFCVCALLGILLMAGTIGCAGLRPADRSESHPEIPIRHELTQVVFFPQQDHQCGPAALAMALQWTGVNVTPSDLSPQVYTPSLQGSLQSALLGAARRHGRVAYAICSMEDLLNQVAADHPVLILQNLGLSWYQVWHYALVVGYDLMARTIVLRSGSTGRREISFQLFHRTWARSQNWAIIILNPTQLPDKPDEARYLDAVLGVENAGRYGEAIASYQTAVTRWPENFPASMGIGNSFYAQGELNQAADAFRQTVRLHPQQGAAYNNLAHVLSELGCWQEALWAARMAVSLGGPMQSTYLRTLQQIEKSSPKTADHHPES